MADILLTHSNHLLSDRKQTRKMQPYPPLQTLMAAACLRREGYEVALFDPALESPEEGFAQALAINMGVVAFAAWRRLPGIGYRFEFDRNQISGALVSFSIFAAIAIPLGFAIGFIRYSFDLSKLALAPAAFLGIYLLVAIPEEVLFRGLIQNWLERVSGRPVFSLMLASIVFGAAHLNNGPVVPNYSYFLMASIAGVFYGLVWQRTGSIAAAAVTHALVDTAWSAAFPLISVTRLE